jgi:hypothetical protein
MSVRVGRPVQGFQQQQVAQQEAPLGQDEEMYPAPEEQMSYEEFILFCNQPTPQHVVKWREGPWNKQEQRNMWLPYIEWHVVADMLDKYWPWWAYTIDSIHEFGGAVAVAASIRIGDVTRSGIGVGLLENFSGDPGMGIKKAESDALKRAATKFGIARDLYQGYGEDEDTGNGQVVSAPMQHQTQQHQSQRQAAPPVQQQSRGVEEPATVAQENFLMRVCSDRNLDPEQECKKLHGVPLDGLSKKNMSVLIDSIVKGQPQIAAIPRQQQIQAPQPIARSVAQPPRPVSVNGGQRPVAARVTIPSVRRR